MQGNTFSFILRVPTDDKLENCRHVTLTDDAPWDLQTVSIQAFETGRQYWIHQQVTDEEAVAWQTILNCYSPTTLTYSMIVTVNIYDRVAVVRVTDWHSLVTPKCLAQIFGCRLETAKQTLKATTQHGI